MSFMEKEQLAKELYGMGREYCVLRIARYLQTIERLEKELADEREGKQDKNS